MPIWTNSLKELTFLVLFFLPVVTATTPTPIEMAVTVTSGTLGLYGGNVSIGNGAKGSAGLVTFTYKRSQGGRKLEICFSIQSCLMFG